MPKVKKYLTDGTQKGEMQLSDEIFGAEFNENAVHQVVVAQLAAERQGTQSALTRAEVRGGGAKPWRQKGTGRARHGSSRSPIWAKGGVVFAPKPRSYDKKVNKKVKRIAMFSALSLKVKEKDMILLEDLKMEAPKTKEFVQILNNLSVSGKALVITANKDEGIVRASGNLQNVKTTVAGAISVYDLMNCDKLIITKEAVKKVEEVYAS